MALRLVAAGNVEYRLWKPSLWAGLLICAALTGITLGIGMAAFLPRGAAGSSEYQLWRWETSTLLDNIFARLGIGPDTNESDGEEALREYFRLTSELRALEAVAQPDLERIDSVIHERAAHENEVERLIERYVTEAVTGAGLERGLPLFNSVRITWPPVDIELTNPPQLLVRSPRDEIRRQGDTLLKNDLSLGEIEGIEDRTTDEDTVSVVLSIGGLAAYPAIVHGDRAYSSILDTSSHEWVHHYLAFYPLGEKWGEGGDANALNETTANIAGREIAALIDRRHPIEFEPGADGRAPSRPPPTIDFNKEMRALRLEVDELLKQGKVSEAEDTMEAKQRFLNENGFSIRRLNQAYFAFYGTYADSPQSSNPIGPKVEKVWELTREVGLFLTVMREVEDVAELDRAIASLEALGVSRSGSSDGRR